MKRTQFLAITGAALVVPATSLPVKALSPDKPWAIQIHWISQDKWGVIYEVVKEKVFIKKFDTPTTIYDIKCYTLNKHNIYECTYFTKNIKWHFDTGWVLKATNMNSNLSSGIGEQKLDAYYAPHYHGKPILIISNDDKPLLHIQKEI